MTHVAVAGVGMHPFGRFPDASLKDLVRTAVVRALDDAGLGIKDIQAVYSANGMGGLLQGQEQIRGQSVLREVGIERRPHRQRGERLRRRVDRLPRGRHRDPGRRGRRRPRGRLREDVRRRPRPVLAALESAADLDVVARARPAVHRRLRDAAAQAARRGLAERGRPACRRRSRATTTDPSTPTPSTARRSRRNRCSAPARSPSRSPCSCAARSATAPPPSWSPRSDKVLTGHPRVTVRASAAASGYQLVRRSLSRHRPNAAPAAPTSRPASARTTSTWPRCTTRWRPANCSTTSSSDCASRAARPTCCAAARPRSTAASPVNPSGGLSLARSPGRRHRPGPDRRARPGSCAARRRPPPSRPAAHRPGAEQRRLAGRRIGRLQHPHPRAS